MDPPSKFPSPRKVTFSGTTTYLGIHGSEESKAAYTRVLAEWTANGGHLPPPPVKLTVAVIANEFMKWATKRYGGTNRLLNIQYAMKSLIQLYGNTLATEFGPKKLKVVRTAMVDAGLARKTITDRVGIIKRIFRKAIEFELLGPEVYDRIKYMDGLEKGEGKPSRVVETVDEDAIEAVRPFVARQVWAVIQLQLLTAARPSELLGLTLSDIDMSGQVWRYTPSDHKTAHHGKDRVIRFGPKAQEILGKFMDRPINAPLFSPREAEQERYNALHEQRKTPESYGTKRHGRINPRIRPSYDDASYRRAIQRGCDLAFPLPSPLAKQQDETGEEWSERLTPAQHEEAKAWKRDHRWFPYQLRHNAATQIEREFDYRATQSVLGHSRGSIITQDYVAADNSLADQVMLKVG